MKKLLMLFMCIFVISCSTNDPVSVVFEPELFPLEIMVWNEIATNNSSNKNSDWNGKAGMLVGHAVRNNNDVDLVVEYILHIRGARTQEDIATLIPLDLAPLLLSVPGLLCRNTNANLDPFDIIEGNIILSGEQLFAIAFAESKGEDGFWKTWWSIYYSVTIRAFTFESLSKGGLIFEYESEPTEIMLR